MQITRSAKAGMCFCSVLSIFVAFSTPSIAEERPPYPATRTVDVVDEVHGEKIPDPYRWLENSEDAEVQAWTAQQNALTRKVLDRFDSPRAELRQRYEKLFEAQIGSCPKAFGDNYFFTKREGLQNQPLLYVRDGSLDAKPRVLIDPNKFAADGTTSLDWWHPSNDGMFVAYGRSDGGTEWSTLHLRDVNTATDGFLKIPRTRACSVAWSIARTGFLYTRYPEPGSVPAGDENYRRWVYYHKFGTEVKDDPCLYGPGRPKEEWTDVANSSDDQYQFLTASLDWSKNDLFMRAMGDAEFKPVAVGLDGVFSPDAFAGKLYLLTSFEAPRYRVLVADAKEPVQANWKEIVPQQTGVIQQLVLAGGKMALNILENATSKLEIHELDGALVKTLELPTLGTVSDVTGRPEKDDLFFRFESFAYPPVVYRYNVKTDELKEFERLEADFDSSPFETKQIWTASKDGTKIPIFVTAKKELNLDGNNPTILYGYGGFEVSETPEFSRGMVPWLEAGGVFAVANIRGGGEFGQEWHAGGRLGKKQNCFDDFAAAAEKLIADGYTKPAKLGAWGGSNGGLLMGAMMTQRPELFGAIVCQVPLLDMLRYQRFSIAQLWIPEYGSADDGEQFKFLRAYSPYQHVKTGSTYPAVFFVTADGDSRVDPMHARKMAAAMQTAASGDKPVLLWVESKAGHGAGKPLSKQIDAQVDLLTFFASQLGMWGG